MLVVCLIYCVYLVLQRSSNLCFLINVASNLEVAWETIYVNNILYVEVPNSILPDGSKER